MTMTHVEATDREMVQVKIFDAPLDHLVALEADINAWLKGSRDARPDRILFNTVDGKRAVVMVWYTVSRSARGVGFGEAIQTGRP